VIRITIKCIGDNSVGLEDLPCFSFRRRSFAKTDIRRQQPIAVEILDHLAPTWSSDSMKQQVTLPCLLAERHRREGVGEWVRQPAPWHAVDWDRSPSFTISVQLNACTRVKCGFVRIVVRILPVQRSACPQVRIYPRPERVHPHHWETDTSINWRIAFHQTVRQAYIVASRNNSTTLQACIAFNRSIHRQYSASLYCTNILYCLLY